MLGQTILTRYLLLGSFDKLVLGGTLEGLGDSLTNLFRGLLGSLSSLLQLFSNNAGGSGALLCLSVRMGVVDQKVVVSVIKHLLSGTSQRQEHRRTGFYLGLAKSILGLLEGIAITDLARLILELLHGVLELLVLLDLFLQGLNELAESRLGLMAGSDEWGRDMAAGRV